MEPTTAPVLAAGPQHVSPARIAALDALRGFALCGILLTNLPTLVHLSPGPAPGRYYAIPDALELVAHQRFFPIFSLLFGMSCALFLDSAARRSAHPRGAFVRRLLALGVLGAIHQEFHPGEALLPYAIFGIAVLLPASYLPRWLVAIGGLSMIAASLIGAGGGISLVPGLFLLGLALAGSGALRQLHRRTRTLAVLLGLSAPLAVAMNWWQHDLTWSADRTTADAVAAGAGLVTALTYSAAVLLLVLHGPMQTVLSRILEPLGRLALTNYLGATVLVLTVAPTLRLPGSARWEAAMGLAAAILGVQVVFSRAWLARFQYGPVEWLLRCATWWTVVPLRRPAPAGPADTSGVKGGERTQLSHRPLPGEPLPQLTNDPGQGA
jgi:uncharacterized protein